MEEMMDGGKRVVVFDGELIERCVVKGDGVGVVFVV